MSDDRLAAALDAWLDGTIMAAELTWLRSRMSEPEVALAVMRRLRLEEDLRERWTPAARAVTAAATPRRWRWPVAVALAAVLILGVLALYAGGSVASAQLTAGTLTVERGGTQVVIGPGARIGSAEQLHGGPAQIAFADGSTVAVAAGSRVRIDRLDARATQLNVDGGTVACVVTRQSSARTFVVATPEAEVTVIGTRFQVERYDGGTSVTVASGRVAVRDRSGRDAVRELGPGESTVVGQPALLMQVRPDGSDAGLLRVEAEDDATRPASMIVDGRAVLRFDGVDDHLIGIGPSPDLAAGMTLFAVVRSAAPGRAPRLLSFGNAAWEDNLAVFWSNDALLLQIKQPLVPNTAATSSELVAPQALLVDTWAVYEVSVDAAGAARIARNGRELAAGTVTPPLAIPRRLTYVGRSLFVEDSYWQGDLAELRVYAGTLAPSVRERIITELLSTHALTRE